MDHSFSIDIIVFAVIAAVLFFRLRKVLGERSDGEPPSIDPALLLRARAAEASLKAPDKTNALPAPATAVNWAQELPDYNVVLNATAHHRLLPLAAVDPHFQPTAFLQTAKRAYEQIITAFAKNDLAALEALLTPDVLNNFKSEITRRQDAKQQFDVQLLNLSQAVISDAELDGTRAYISVDFTTDQQVTHRDEAGQFINDQDGTKQIIRERFVFTRDLKETDTTWRLSETDQLDD